MTIKKLLNFNKEDCIHFSWTFSQGCCGRGLVKSGACTISNEKGESINKVCSTSMKYCNYKKKEE